MNIEQIARATHHVNRAYCQALGDNSHAYWENAPEWQRESVLAGVRAVFDGTATTPEAQHRDWYIRKVADGWTRGDVKDVEKKTHPCMVRYDDLPASQKAKNFIFRAVVEGLSGAA